MKSVSFVFALGLAGAIACAAGASPPDRNLHELMKQVVAVQTQVIWDIGNRALNDAGNPDPSKIKDADWKKIATTGGSLKDAANALADAKQIVAAAPGQKIADEQNPGSLNAKGVQKAIDANPQLFRAMARQLAVSMDQIVQSTRTRDAAKFLDVSGRLDQVCEQCHVQFWYPEQKAAR